MENRSRMDFSERKKLAPVAQGRGNWGRQARLRIARDGGGEVITMLPTSMTDVQKFLQYAWVGLDAALADEVGKEPPCASLY